MAAPEHKSAEFLQYQLATERSESKLSKKRIIRDMVVTAEEILVLNSSTWIEIAHTRP